MKKNRKIRILDLWHFPSKELLTTTFLSHVHANWMNIFSLNIVGLRLHIVVRQSLNSYCRPIYNRPLCFQIRWTDIWVWQELSSNWDGLPFGHNRHGELGPHLTQSSLGRGGAEAYTCMRDKFHLDSSNRLATIRQRHRQDRTDRQDRLGQRSDSIGRTFLQTVRPKMVHCKQGVRQV